MNANKLIKEIKEAKQWIEQNKKFVSLLSQNKIINHNTQEVRALNENELSLKSTWIINNLIQQTNQYKLIIDNTNKLINLTY